jgi:hypothetical protein
MAGFLITPSLYSAWRYWKNSEEAGEDILDTLNKKERETSSAMQAGIDFEEAVRRFCDGMESEDFCVMEAGERVQGGIWQQRIGRELDGDLVYGIADVIRRNTIFDLKRVHKYDLGKYESSIQHLVYMYATEIPNFEYVISDGREVYIEAYHWETRSFETLKERIVEMKESILFDDEMRRAFQANWTYRQEDKL